MKRGVQTSYNFNATNNANHNYYNLVAKFSVQETVIELTPIIDHSNTR